ncbi:LysR family transcriptional regulator [Psychromarinibacter sp. C21-152]|uniref:LysR family transcriptional regulator n=1 Tax=Psychromarinibacter sediminicola TaxID=3033385 RepID=A0AAE3NUK6_9RHOB|nr:LysR family transcriptional regulator [Psychromarinibacter sediminicola]MDF0603838.1 LysR family transcriptional regulator [Psychromarinibacter sediminicola]
MADFDLDDLHAFALIAACGGVSAAARRHDLSKATLSRSLARLERAAGAPLFDRLPHGLVLTPGGEMLIERANEAQALRQGVEDLFRAAETEPAGPLRIAGSAMTVDSLLARSVAELSRRYPALRPEIRVAAHGTDPVTDDLDIAVRVGRPTAPHLVARRIAVSQLGLYAGAAVAADLDAHRPETLADMGRIVVRPETDTDAWQLTGPDGQVVRIDGTPRFTVDDPVAAIALMRAGEGMTLLPRFYADALLPARAIVPLMSDHVGPKIELYAALPPRRSRVPAVRAFLEVIARQARSVERTAEASANSG